MVTTGYRESRAVGRSTEGHSRKTPAHVILRAERRAWLARAAEFICSWFHYGRSRLRKTIALQTCPDSIFQLANPNTIGTVPAARSRESCRNERHGFECAVNDLRAISRKNQGNWIGDSGWGFRPKESSHHGSSVSSVSIIPAIWRLCCVSCSRPFSPALVRHSTSPPGCCHRPLHSTSKWVKS